MAMLQSTPRALAAALVLSLRLVAVHGTSCQVSDMEVGVHNFWETGYHDASKPSNGLNFAIPDGGLVVHSGGITFGGDGTITFEGDAGSDFSEANLKQFITAPTGFSMVSVKTRASNWKWPKLCRDLFAANKKGPGHVCGKVFQTYYHAEKNTTINCGSTTANRLSEDYVITKMCSAACVKDRKSTCCFVQEKFSRLFPCCRSKGCCPDQGDSDPTRTAKVAPTAPPTRAGSDLKTHFGFGMSITHANCPPASGGTCAKQCTCAKGKKELVHAGGDATCYVCRVVPYAAPPGCWEAHKPDFPSCAGYKGAGYTCTGNYCAAMSPGGTPSRCAKKMPAGYIVDADTGKCVMARLTSSGEKLVSVGLCPHYKPDCGNSASQTGAKVGDACAIACESFNGARWCPTTSDHSGNGGTPWGWCPQFQSGTTNRPTGAYTDTGAPTARVEANSTGSPTSTTSGTPSWVGFGQPQRGCCVDSQGRVPKPYATDSVHVGGDTREKTAEVKRCIALCASSTTCTACFFNAQWGANECQLYNASTVGWRTSTVVQGQLKERGGGRVGLCDDALDKCIIKTPAGRPRRLAQSPRKAPTGKRPRRAQAAIAISVTVAISVEENSASRSVFDQLLGCLLHRPNSTCTDTSIVSGH